MPQISIIEDDSGFAVVIVVAKGLLQRDAEILVDKLEGNMAFVQLEAPSKTLN